LNTLYFDQWRPINDGYPVFAFGGQATIL
jgi:hypothetical protein